MKRPKNTMSRKSSLETISVFFFLCMFAISCSDDPSGPKTKGYTVYGRVVDSSGKGVAGVTVTIEGLNLTREGVTDTNGLFAVTGLKNGIFFVTAGKKSYRFILPQTEITILNSDVILEYIIAELVPDPESLGIVMVDIPAGTFSMGSDEGEPREKPVHTVTLDEFEISAYEITQGQFEKIMNKNPSRFAGSENLPVEQVTWFDAAQFCNNLSDMNGLRRCYNDQTWSCDFSANGFRLPTEAEWEYACRAGTTTAYNSGDTVDDLARAGWYSKNSGAITHIVGLKEPNAWGLYDMHGNVFEWCNDWYDTEYYTLSPEKNPTGSETGASRITRGGSWFDSSGSCRSAYRRFYEPIFIRSSFGFRIVRREQW